MHYIAELSGLLKISLKYHLLKISARSSKLGFVENAGCPPCGFCCLIWRNANHQKNSRYPYTGFI